MNSRARSGPQERRRAPYSQATPIAANLAPMRCFVYVLATSVKSGVRTYVGWTTDLERRLARHNEGDGARATRGRVWGLIYAETYNSRGEAMSREWHLKRDRGFRKRLTNGL